MARASSRENFSFFTRNWVAPKADKEASENVGCSNSASKESTGLSSQVPCFVSRCRPAYLPFFPVAGSFPHRTYLLIVSNSSSVISSHSNCCYSKYLFKNSILSMVVLNEKSSFSLLFAINTLYVYVHR